MVEELEKKTEELIKQAYKDGYKQGQKDKLTDKEKLVGTFINVDLEKEKEELKAQIEKMKNCGNCNAKNCNYQKIKAIMECVDNNRKSWELAE